MWATVEGIQPARLHRFFNLLLSGAEEISRSSFPKLSLEMLVLRLCQQGTTLPIADVLEGLERLETRLGHLNDGQPVLTDEGHSEPIEHLHSDAPSDVLEISPVSTKCSSRGQRGLSATRADPPVR